MLRTKSIMDVWYDFDNRAIGLLLNITMNEQPDLYFISCVVGSYCSNTNNIYIISVSLFSNV